MKHLTKIMLLAVVLVSFTGVACAQNRKVMEEREKLLSPYPQAEKGMVRHVIFLDKKSDESMFKIELIPGKMMNVDCNLHSLMGNIEEKDVPGWGYSYYVFTSNGQTRSTMMACNKPNEDRFVMSQSMLVRYNSKLPLVIYAPEGYEIKYSIWKAGRVMSMPTR